MAKVLAVLVLALAVAAALVLAEVQQPPKLASAGSGPSGAETPGSYPIVNNGGKPYPRIPCEQGLKSGWQCCGKYQFPGDWFCCVSGNGCPRGTTCSLQPATVGNDCLVGNGGNGEFGKINSIQF